MFSRFALRTAQRNFTLSSRRFSTYSHQWSQRTAPLARPVTIGFLGFLFGSSVDYDAVRKELAECLDDLDYDDGSWGPVLVRLAWHASGTYNKADGTGGSNGATMRFEPECLDGANAGLEKARAKLEAIKEKYPSITYADLWVLASYVAIEEMGGPAIEFKPGRSDKGDGTHCPPVGRLPDAAQGAQHIRDVFYRMGFNDQEIVALAGAHALGRCHKDRSGFDGPWTRAPTTMSNEYYRVLFEEKWTVRNWDGPKQFENEAKDLMMLPADLAFKTDPEFRKYSQLYYKDNERFLQDFGAAFKKLTELGLD